MRTNVKCQYGDDRKVLISLEWEPPRWSFVGVRNHNTDYKILDMRPHITIKKICIKKNQMIVLTIGLYKYSS